MTSLAHQTNEHYLDLSKKLKKVEERMITGVEEAVSKELQQVKDSISNCHKDVKNVMILFKNIETSLAISNDEFTDTDEEDKFSDERTQNVPSNKPF